MPIVYSTLSCHQKYSTYSKLETNNIRRLKYVIIHGGANVPTVFNPDVPRPIITPRGAATQVTKEQLDILLSNPCFKDHLARGHLKIDESDIDMSDERKVSIAVDEAVKDMTPRDKSACKIKEDFEALNLPTPKSSNFDNLVESKKSEKGKNKS